jgi:hypothetical protein
MIFPRRIARRPTIEEPGAGIRLGAGRTGADGPPWGRLLVLFMRGLALLWIAQGLLQWSAFLLPDRPIFDNMTNAAAAAMMFFCVLDLVAAVGLWLATPWGGAIWLFAATAQILTAIALPRFFWGGWVPVNVLLILVYFGLTWQASRLQGGWPGDRYRRPR